MAINTTNTIEQWRLAFNALDSDFYAQEDRITDIELNYLKNTGNFTKISGDITINDNAKLIFGTGSDLEIYHDGSNTIISETGTGGLNINSSLVTIDNLSVSTSLSLPANTIDTVDVNNDAITFAKMQNVVAQRLLGNATGPTDNVQELTITGSGSTSVAWDSDGITISSTGTTYSAGNGISLSGTTFSVAAGTGLTQTATGLSHTSHTGDVTGSTALTIANDAVTYAKMQNVGTANRVLGSTSAGGIVSEVQVNTDMIASGAVNSSKVTTSSTLIIYNSAGSAVKTINAF